MNVKHGVEAMGGFAKGSTLAAPGSESGQRRGYATEDGMSWRLEKRIILLSSGVAVVSRMVPSSMLTSRVTGYGAVLVKNHVSLGNVTDRACMW